MVGEDVKVARRCCVRALLPPLLETQVEDEDVDRQEEDHIGDDGGRDHGKAKCGV